MNLDALSDHDLMRRCREGQEDAFTALFDRHAQRTLNFAYRLTGNREDAAEVLQDTFRYLFSKVDTWTPDAKLTTLLYKVTRNLALNRLRKARRDAHAPLDEALIVPSRGDTPDGALLRDERFSLAQQALDSLPDLHREVLVLRMIEDLSYRDMADILGIKEGTVKSRVHNGIEKLREAYRKLAGSDELSGAGGAEEKEGVVG